MEALMLYYRSEPLREFALEERALEVGRGSGCDIVVHDPDVDERHLLVRAAGGTVVLHELTRCPTSARALPPNEHFPLGRWHSLVRVPDAVTRPTDAVRTTDPIAVDGGSRPAITLVVGRGRDARRVALEARPLTIGSASTCDVIVHDRAVSARHCRVEPGADGWRVRDLGSRNGTHVESVRVALARVDAGATIRIGRTDVRLVARDPAPVVGRMVACSAALRDVLATVERLAKLPWSLLIVGESGTGKEALARAAHEQGPRSAGPFVAVNAGGMPPSLVESELFGHERGAFTGAGSTHRGVFEQAHGGTLFLDEIGELPLELQARLLRVLETWEVRRVGAERSLRVDVRLVCATHRDLRAMVAEGQMRQDLYFRIAQLVVEVPPLRERMEDVPPLAEHFLERSCEQLGPRSLSCDAVARLLAYDWPGNARELRNVVLRAAACCPSSCVSGEDVSRAFADAGCDPQREAEADEPLLYVLAQHRGNLTATARALGLPRTTLRDRLRRARQRRDRGAR